jgi:hypothetical protein
MLKTREVHATDMTPLSFATFHHRKAPAYFQLWGLDLFRDEGLVYEKVLKENYGLKTKLDSCSGLPLRFWQMMPRLKAVKRRSYEWVCVVVESDLVGYEDIKAVSRRVVARSDRFLHTHHVLIKLPISVEFDLFH